MYQVSNRRTCFGREIPKCRLTALVEFVLGLGITVRLREGTRFLTFGAGGIALIGVVFQ